MANSSSSSFSSSSFERSYDVFLSFRGEDTRNNFTAHLYKELRTKGINAFIDEKRIERGQVISPALVAAIENSMFSIVVLSENYASSRCCLEELVKILECKESRGQIVLPIFYHVDPSDVRKHLGKFGEALAKHEENWENMDRVQIWRDALTQVAKVSGWDSWNKNETLLIKEIIKDILNKLLSIFVSNTENLVGIDDRIQEMEMLLCLESNDVQMIGIWGMGGIGKTTLARAIYNKICRQFEACSFCENLEEDLEKGGLIRLQQKFLSQLLEEENLNMKGLTSIKARLHLKKVFIVLDNVNNPTIVECLIGNKDWFGQGSRIIITTRDKRLLISCRLNYYKARKFNYAEGFEFLVHYSLKHELLRDEFMELSREVIGYAQGLPLALKVLGSSLFSMSKEEWRNELEKLKRTPNKKIQEILKISYDGLDDKEKDIFLDIACFFKGEDKDYVMEILDGCGFFPFCGIRTLIDKSLINISLNKLEMHDLIQEMGREIVRQQSLKELGQRSRLWFHEDIYDVLRRNMATEKIEGIFLNLSHLEEILDFTTQAFAGMNRLRLLKVYTSNSISRYFQDTSDMENCEVKFSKDFKFCYNDLRCLYLYGYSFKSLPNDFNPKNLVELSLPYSHIKQLWKGVKVLEKLKFMDLSHSKHLIETPDFSRITNLQRLVLEDCVSLYKVHSSLEDLKNLNFLSLKNCKMLKSLPSSTCDLKCLETFILSGCSKFEEFPENFGNLEMVKEIHADGTAIRVLPSSFYFLRNLEMLTFKGCKGPPSSSWLLSRRSSNFIGSIVHSLSGLCSLRSLCLSNCNLSDETSLSNLGFLSSLEKLDLSGNNFLTLPSSINQLSNLISLRLNNCKRLEALPQLPSSIYYINAKNCTSLTNVSYQVLQSLFANRKSSDGTFHGVATSAGKLFALICGSQIPNWIRYQSWGRKVKAELPPNWFSSNFFGFVFVVLFVPKLCTFHLRSPRLYCDISLLIYDTSSHISPILLDSYMFENYESVESDHVSLLYAPLPYLNKRHQGTREKWHQRPHIDWHQATHISLSFAIKPSEINSGIQRCGIGLVYSDEYGNHNKSTVALKEIHEEEPSGSGWSNNVDGSESDNSDYFTTEEGESIANACSEGHSESENSDYCTANEEEPISTNFSEDHSESEMQPLKLLKCSHYHDILLCGETDRTNA